MMLKRLNVSGTVFMFVLLSVLSGCNKGNGSQDVKNYNSELYNTEWSSNDHSEGILFYNDDTCLSFAGAARDKGTFSYEKFSVPINGTIGRVVFYGLENNFPTYTCVNDYGYMLEDGSMKLCWRYLGEEKGYYTMLYRRK